MTQAQREFHDLTERFITHAYNTEFTDFSAATIQRATHRILDAVGNTLVGHRASGMSALTDLAVDWGGAPQSTILGDGRKVPMQHAALLNAVLMRSFDFEPVGAEGPGRRQVAAHITGTTVPVALAVAEHTEATPQEFLTALLVGEDIAARLAFGSGFDVYSGQDNTGTVNGIGATFVAALLLKLTPEQTRHALGIVTNQLAGNVAAIFDQASAFKLPMGFAARNAIVAAQLAAAGMTGPDDPMEGSFGFIDLFCADPKPEVMVERLGIDHYADSVIKPWSCCRAAQPSLDATVRLRDAHELNSDEAFNHIDQVIVHVTPRTAQGFVGNSFSVGTCPEVSAAFSIHYTTAAALVYGTVRPEHMTLDAMQDPRIQAMLERIVIRGTLDPTEVLTAEVEINLHDGQRLMQRVDAPRGDIYHSPLSEAEILEKFHQNVAYSQRMSTTAAQELLEQIQKLAELPSMTELLDLLGSRSATPVA
ncbi:MAG TPA: MmgE/PrpD family protein [Yaniella sp.]